MKRRNPIPQAWGTAPIKFVDQDSPNENLDGEDLRNANLKGSNLSGSSFRNADLEGAVLSGCDLRNCDFTGANLDRTNLAFASVEGAIFDRCSMDTTLLFDPEELFVISDFNPSRIKISGYVIDASRESLNDGFTEMRKSDDADLLNQYIELVQALGGDLGLGEIPMQNNRITIQRPYPLRPRQGRLVVYNFEGLNFSYFSLEEAEFTGISFANSICLDGTFDGAFFKDVSFRDADLRDSSWDLSVNQSNIGVECLDVDFRGADLRGSIVYQAEFSGCDFRGATFRGGEWQYFTLHNCDLRGVDLSGLNLNYYAVELEKDTWLMKSVCRGSTYNDKTKLFELNPRVKELILKQMVYVP